MSEPLQMNIQYGVKVVRPEILMRFEIVPPRPLTFAEKAWPYVWGATCLVGGILGCVAVAVALFLLHAPPNLGVLLGLVVGFVAFNVWSSRA